MLMKDKKETITVWSGFAFRAAACILLAIAAGFALLVLAYCLPTEKIRRNVAASGEQVSSEGCYYQWAKGYKNAQTDTYTDASLILNAMYPGSGSPVRDAMNAPRILYGEDDNEASVGKLANGVQADTHEVFYGRYWHGILIFLKPLLLFFDLADIRMITMMVQFLLLFLVLVGFVRRKKERELVGFFAAVILINPVTMIMGLCFSAEYILTLLVAAVMLFYHEKLAEGMGYYYLFLWSGILFVYFNELSFPVIGLGIPLVIYLLLSGEDTRGLIRKEIAFTALWGSGYVGVWIGKWILAWIFTGYNYFGEALEQAARYTSDHSTWEVQNPSLMERLAKNIDVYQKWPYLLLVMGIVLFLVLYTVRRRQRITGESVTGMLPYFLLVLLPFAVFTALGNGYSYVHYWFTHRLLSISAFAGVCMILRLTDEKRIV